MAQRLLPGGAYLDETAAAQRLVPGGAYVNETAAADVFTLTVTPMELAWAHGAITLSLSSGFSRIDSVFTFNPVVLSSDAEAVFTLTVTPLASVFGWPAVGLSGPAVAATGALIPGGPYFNFVQDATALIPGGAYVQDQVPTEPEPEPGDGAGAVQFYHHHYAAA